MIIPVEQLTLDQAREELNKHLSKEQMSQWAVGRVQQLTYRIHELDQTENETVKLDAQ